MKKLFFTILLGIAISLASHAKETLDVISFHAVKGDKTAITTPVNDGNGIPCALLLVSIDDPESVITGDGIVGKPVYDGNQYAVWLSADDSRRIVVASSKAVPTTVEFADYGIDELESGRVYNLALASPPVDQASIKKPGTLNIDYFPYGAVVFINGNKVGTTPCVIKDLKKGKYTVTIWAKGFDVFEEKVKIDNWRSVNLTGSLFKRYKATGRLSHLANNYKKEKVTETKNGKTVTKTNYKVTSQDTVISHEEVKLRFAFIDPAAFGKDDDFFGMLDEPVSNHLWRVVMGDKASQAVSSESEIVDAYFLDRKVKVNAADAQLFCEKLSELYGRKFRLASFNELRWAKIMNIVKGLKNEEAELSIEDASVGNKERRFRVVLADVSEADLDIGNPAEVINITMDDVKRSKKEIKTTNPFVRALKGLATDAIRMTVAE